MISHRRPGRTAFVVAALFGVAAAWFALWFYAVVDLEATKPQPNLLAAIALAFLVLAIMAARAGIRSRRRENQHVAFYDAAAVKPSDRS